MNSWIKKIIDPFNRYMKIQKAFTHLLPTKYVIGSMMMSVIYALIVLLIPILIGVNLVIFIQLRTILVLYFVALGVLFIEIYENMFIKFAVKYEPSLSKLNLKLMIGVEKRLLQFVFILIYSLIILQLGVLNV
jgi:hypothetical protein